MKCAADGKLRLAIYLRCAHSFAVKGCPLLLLLKWNDGIAGFFWVSAYELTLKYPLISGWLQESCLSFRLRNVMDGIIPALSNLIPTVGKRRVRDMISYPSLDH